MGEFNLLTDGRQANRIAQLRRALDGNPIHSGDHIAFDEAGPGCEAAPKVDPSQGKRSALV